MKLTRVVIKFITWIYSLFTYRSHAAALANKGRKTPNTDITMRIDCEVKENDHNGFKNKRFLCIEWHLKGAARNKEILHQNNFIVFDMASGQAVEYDMICRFRTFGL